MSKPIFKLRFFDHRKQEMNYKFNELLNINDLNSGLEQVTWMLWSGLIDGNKIDIYDGDILLLLPYNVRFMVSYAKPSPGGAYWWCVSPINSIPEYYQNIRLDQIPLLACEIVGNKYENPELLKEQSDE